MEDTKLDTALESRLSTLSSRIASLKQNMKTATGSVIVEDAGVISQLEARHKILKEQLRQLNLAGATFPEKIESEIAVMVDDLTSAVDDIMARASAADRPPS